ncbi:MAG: hypothetical protein ACRDQC_14180 [Gaiellales bacterium]
MSSPGYARSALDELGEGVFRKVRRELGITAFGVNAMVLPPGAHAEMVRNAGDVDLVLLIVGGHDGYAGRDGHMVDPADEERRRRFSAGGDLPS